MRAHLLERLTTVVGRRRHDARDIGVVEADDREILRHARPRSRAAWIAPTAILSFEAKIAVGGSAIASSGGLPGGRPRSRSSPGRRAPGEGARPALASAA